MGGGVASQGAEQGPRSVSYWRSLHSVLNSREKLQRKLHELAGETERWGRAAAALHVPSEAPTI